jgi:hypothetical protein
MMANSVVRDEIERRSGIRKAVLEATGLTPAQVQVQMAQEQLGGVNGRVIDMRDRQVQDAVNLYYLINNLPPPATAEGTADKVPSSVAPAGAGGKEVDEDEAGLEFADGGELGDEEADGVANQVVARRFGEEFPVVRPEVALPETPEEVSTLSKRRLVEIIIAYRMFDPNITTRTGSIMTATTMERLDKDLLVSIVLSGIARFNGAGRRRVDNRAGGGVGNVAGGGAAAGDDEW